MDAREVAEHIARDASCAQGEFHQRVLSIIPYLTEYADEIKHLRALVDTYHLTAAGSMRIHGERMPETEK